MRHTKLSLAIIIALTWLSSFAQDDWSVLFNGKDLSGWDTYVGPKYEESKNEFSGDPMGFNNDPDKVFSVVTVEGRSALRISGQHFGGISTKQEFENYHLRLQFKWGEMKWIPRKDSKRDSGILYHAVGPHAKGWFFWMCSEEFQIQEGDCGDYWGVGGGSADGPAVEKKAGEYAYDANGKLMIFGSSKSRASNHLVKYQNGENPNGQWNTIDLYVHGDTSLYVVNNIFVNKLYKLRKSGDNAGAEYPLTKGKIQLQSEGAEVFYRDIKIKPIKRLPIF